MLRAGWTGVGERHVRRKERRLAAYIRRHLSFPPLATRCPSGLQSTAKTCTPHTRWETRHRFAVAQLLWPSLTSSAWPGRSMFNLPVLMSQTLRVLSLLPLTSSLLSADQATWYTEDTWPRRDMRYLGEKARVAKTGLTAPPTGQTSVLQSFQFEDFRLHSIKNTQDALLKEVEINWCNKMCCIIGEVCIGCSAITNN